MTVEPLVSVGLPIRNEERHLADTLDDLLAQNYDNLEIVISDNASTDRTQEICRSYAMRDPRISYHRQERDRGAVENFNEAFRRSSGEYFTWASGHDRRAPSAIRACVEFLEARPDVLLCYPRSLFADFAGHSGEIDDDRLETTGLRAPRRLAVTIRDLGRCNAFHGVIRSSALARTRLCRPCLGTDNVLLSELSVLGSIHQIEPRLFIRTENRPPESSDATESRLFAMLGITDGRSKKRPYTYMVWEHVRGVWHVADGLRAKLSLTVVAVCALLPVWHRLMFEECFPRLLRAGRVAKRLLSSR
jgi:glycosyltransferase involved in cell wall biosynthesis